MVSQRAKVIIPQGMHMLPAQMFVAEMTRYDSAVTIFFGGKAINGKNLMELMASCLRMGSEVEVHCEGADEAGALAAAVRLLESGLSGM